MLAEWLACLATRGPGLQSPNDCGGSKGLGLESYEAYLTGRMVKSDT